MNDPYRNIASQLWDKPLVEVSMIERTLVKQYYWSHLYGRDSPGLTDAEKQTIRAILKFEERRTHFENAGYQL